MAADLGVGSAEVDSVAVAAGLAAAEPQEDGDMTSLAESFLTQHEQQRVSEAVHAAELRTSGEIVPMIVSASHHYPLACAAGGAILALPVALLLTALIGRYLWLGPENMYLFLALFAMLYLPARALVAHTLWLKRFFLNRDQVEEEVEEAAITSFYEEGLYRTRAENGILIFISVFEHKVWILADKGIDERIDTSQWQEIVAELSQGIQTGRRCESLCEAVQRVGEILAVHFPIADNDRNELHNIIIR